MKEENVNSKPREIVFYCKVCQFPSYYARLKIDFEGLSEPIEIPVCGECLRKADHQTVISVTVNELISLVPPKITEARMREVLTEYRQFRQGA
jgi:hypothetical protein